VFWKYQAALFAADSLSPEVFKKTAVTLGLDLSRFSACTNSEVARTAILKDLDEAKRLGINSTPTFIINGRVLRGALSFEDFQAAIQHEIRSAQETAFPPK
jgi:predicted DsbA family dithiol-disulfide isomerase